MRARKLKFALALAGALFFLVGGARAQTQTNVTATVSDPLGIPYANGSYSIQLIPSGTNPTVNGAGIGATNNGRLDANGSFNVSLWPNASIQINNVPGASQWQFTICTNSGGVPPPLGTGNQCTPPTLVTIAGVSQSLSATLSAVAPRLSLIGSSGSGFITGTISATQVAFGTALNAIGGDPSFTFSSVTKILGVNGLVITQPSAATIAFTDTNTTIPGAQFTATLDNTGNYTQTYASPTVGNQIFQQWLATAVWTISDSNGVNAVAISVDPTLPGVNFQTGGAITLFSFNTSTGAAIFGIDNTTAGTLQLANDIAAAHTIWGSAATTTNTILGFATVPTTNDLISCVKSGTTCTLTDTGITSANIVKTNQTNVYGAFLQDFTAATMEVPEAAGFTTNVNSTIGLDTTANSVHFFTNGADSINIAIATTPVGSRCLQTSGTTGLATETGAACASGTPALSAITAATGSHTIANGNNPQTWNWTLTTDAIDGIAFGETAAATNGTLTNGLANQAIVAISTATNSTATPFEVVQGSITNTVATPLAQFETTWNNAGLTGAGIVLNVTNTASAAGSLLENLQVGNVSQWKVDKLGNITALGTVSCGLAGTTSCVITGAGATSGTATITWPAVAGTVTNPIAFSNNISGPNGTAAAPTFSFSTNPNSGMYNTGGGAPTFSVLGTVVMDISGTGPRVGSFVYGMAASIGIGSDTGLSRDSAGVVDVGTGAAGSKAGSLNLNSYNVAGNGIMSSGGIFTTYNGDTLVGKGVPYTWSNVDLTAQTAAIAATTLKAVTANEAGFIQVCYVATVTTAASVSSALGGTTGFQVRFTDANDSVVKTYAETNPVISAANTTGSTISGCQVAYAKSGTNLQYLMGYTSSGTAMAYDLSVRVLVVGP
jgi:hypothetical protein